MPSIQGNVTNARSRDPTQPIPPDKHNRHPSLSLPLKILSHTYLTRLHPPTHACTHAHARTRARAHTHTHTRGSVVEGGAPGLLEGGGGVRQRLHQRLPRV